MLRYTLRRILLMLPTLVVISLLAFALNECTPSPVVEPLPGGNASKAPLEVYDQERKNMLRQAKLRGADLPLFYCGIHSAAYPDTLHRILPREQRTAIQGLIAQYGNWPAIQSYTHRLTSSIRTSLLLRDRFADNSLIEISRLLQQLPNRSEADDIQRILRAVEAEVLKVPSDQSTQIRQSVGELQASYAALIANPTPGQHYLPRLQWNGLNNRYHRWISQILSGDLGTSRVSGQDVSERVTNALRWTLRLNLSAFILAYLLAIPLGVYAAVYAGSKFDQRLSIFLFFIYALPSFWVAILLAQFLASPEWLNIFPSMGVGEVAADASWWERTRTRAYYFFLPIFCLTYGILAVITRQVRTAMQGILQSDFIRTARAKGLSERRVIWRHAFPNALFPLITMFGSLLPGVIAGAIVIELIFNIPGVGVLTYESIINEDWPVVYALLLLTAILTVVGILLADLLYAWVDPRVQLGQKNQGANG